MILYYYNCIIKCWDLLDCTLYLRCLDSNSGMYKLLYLFACSIEVRILIICTCFAARPVPSCVPFELLCSRCAESSGRLPFQCTFYDTFLWRSRVLTEVSPLTLTWFLLYNLQLPFDPYVVTLPFYQSLLFWLRFYHSSVRIIV